MKSSNHSTQTESYSDYKEKQIKMLKMESGDAIGKIKGSSLTENDQKEFVKEQIIKLTQLL